jgi:hypothetical protein
MSEMRMPEPRSPNASDLGWGTRQKSKEPALLLRFFALVGHERAR